MLLIFRPLLTLLEHHVLEGFAMLRGKLIPKKLDLPERPPAFSSQGLSCLVHVIVPFGHVPEGDVRSGNDISERLDE